MRDGGLGRAQGSEERLRWGKGQSCSTQDDGEGGWGGGEGEVRGYGQPAQTKVVGRVCLGGEGGEEEGMKLG